MKVKASDLQVNYDAGAGSAHASMRFAMVRAGQVSHDNQLSSS